MAQIQVFQSQCRLNAWNSLGFIPGTMSVSLRYMAAVTLLFVLVCGFSQNRIGVVEYFHAA